MKFRAATRILAVGGSLVFTAVVGASEPFELPLWSGVAPGSENAHAVIETIEERGSVEQPNRRIKGVTVPTVTVYRPPEGNDTGAAILICPGGGYSGEAVDKEGHDIARYLNTIGVTGLVLKYRLPRSDGFVFGHDIPLRDAARAMRLARHHADEWGLDVGRIGVMGFSAGGHLASTLATQSEGVAGNPDDPVDRESAKPDFQVLVYPVISLQEGVAHAGLVRKLLGDEPVPALLDPYSNELQVAANNPPAFLVSTYDDHVKAENSLLYFKALQAVAVPAELHIYETGGHGYGIIPSGKPVATWHHRMAEWMRERGLLEP